MLLSRPALPTRIRQATLSPSLRVVSGLAAQATLSAVFAVLTARWMGPQDRGVVVVTTTTVSLLMLLGGLGAATGGRRLLSQDAANYSMKRHSRLAVQLCSVHMITIAAIGIPVLALSGGWRGLEVAILFGLYGVTMLAVYILREGVHGTGRHAWATLGDVILNCTLVAGVILLHTHSQLTILSVTLLLLVAALVEAIYLAILVTRSRSHANAQRQISFAALLAISAPALAGAMAQAFVIRGDRLMLGAIVDSRAVGIYGTAATFTETLWLIPMGVGQILFRLAARGDYAKIRRLQTTSILCVMVLALLVAISARPLVGFLLGDQYLLSVPLIWLLLAASIPMAIYHLQAPVLNGSGDFKGAAFAAGLSAAVLAVLSLALIPRWDEFGAGVASLVAYICMALFTTLRVRKLKLTSSRDHHLATSERSPAR